MLKTAKRIQPSTQLRVLQKELQKTDNHCKSEAALSSLFNMDPYPKLEKPPKMDLSLHQLEDFE